MNPMRNRLCFALLAALPLCAAAAGAPDLVLVPSAQGGDKYQMSFDDKHINVEVGAETLSATSKAGVRYYRKGQNGEALAQIKYDELHGLKIKDPADKLLWKVKFDGDKVKIADNDELKNAYVIKVKDDQAKVFNAKNVELGAVKKSADTGKIKLKDAHDKELYVVETGHMSAGYGVLLLKDIPALQRDILVTEIVLQAH